MKRITKKFLARNTMDVARDLLGCVLCRKIDDKILRGKIVEVEAYTQDDPACHAYRGYSERSKSLFKKPGTVYVYLIYGLHHCVNIVTDREGYGSGILIRALEPIENIDDTNGPAKLAKAMNITRELDGCDIMQKDSPIWLEKLEKLEKDESIDFNNIIQTTRIGISKAMDYPRRFYIKDNKWVSKR